jgi:hypothetical protein
MKLKVATTAALFCGLSAAADAAPPAGLNLNLGGLLTPAVGLANTALPALNPLLQPVLTQTAPVVGGFVASLHPTLVQLAPAFKTIDTLAGVVQVPAIPLVGLPQ